MQKKFIVDKDYTFVAAVSNSKNDDHKKRRDTKFGYTVDDGEIQEFVDANHKRIRAKIVDGKLKLTVRFFEEHVGKKIEVFAYTKTPGDGKSFRAEVVNAIGGIFINEKGKEIGSDGDQLNNGKVFVVKTTKTKFDSKVPSVGITKKEAKKVEEFVETNSGNKEAFQGSSIAYDNSVEIEGNVTTRQLMVDIVNQDNGRGGTSDANNREYGGIVLNDGTVVESPPGEVADPSLVSSIGITHKIPRNTKSVFHSHPSGTKSTVEEVDSVNDTSGSSSLGRGGEDAKFLSAPSETDVTGSFRTNYVFNRGSNKIVYIYSGSGVIATIPQKRFITPKK